MVKRQPDHDPGGNSSLDCVIQLEFVKSALTVNPCMVCIHFLLQVILFEILTIMRHAGEN